MPDIKSEINCGDMAKELFETRGNDYCVGLIIHLTMYISGLFSKKESEGKKA